MSANRSHKRRTAVDEGWTLSSSRPSKRPSLAAVPGPGLGRQAINDGWSLNGADRLLRDLPRPAMPAPRLPGLPPPLSAAERRALAARATARTAATPASPVHEMPHARTPPQRVARPPVSTSAVPPPIPADAKHANPALRPRTGPVQPAPPPVRAVGSGVIPAAQLRGPVGDSQLPLPLPPPPPTLGLTAYEVAFFAAGDALGDAAPTDDFSDLDPVGPSGFWHRLLQRP